MALSSGNKFLWEDIEALYGALNTERIRFGFNAASIPDEQNDIIDDADLANLKAAIQEMTSHRNLGTIASTSGVETIVEGGLAKPLAIQQMDEIIDNIRAANANSFFSTTASRNGTNFSSFFSTVTSKNSGNFSSFFSTTASRNGTNFSGFFSTTASRNGTNFSGFFSTTASKNGVNFGSFFSSGSSANSGNFSSFKSSGASANSGNFSNFLSTNFASYCWNFRATNSVCFSGSFGF